MPLGLLLGIGLLLLVADGGGGDDDDGVDWFDVEVKSELAPLECTSSFA